MEKIVSVRKILTILLVFTLVFAAIFTLSACGKCKHVDEDGDGKCDKCDNDYTPTANDLALIDEYGIVKFQFVVADGLPEDVKRIIEDTTRALKEADIEIAVVEDKEETVKGCEVLIGEVKTRGQNYLYDSHTLGKEGYVMKIVGQKVVINAGSPETLLTTVQKFISDILGYKNGNTDLFDVVMKLDDQKEYIQSDYKVSGLSVNGVDMKGYTIAIDKENKTYMEAALYLQDSVYGKTGYWFEIVSLAEADKSIVIKEIPKKAGDGSFKITANSDNQLVIECAYSNKLYDSIVAFYIDKISIASSAVNFEGNVMSSDISVIYYEDYGAKGDGRTNDFAAIKKAHDVANEGGQTVKSKNPTKATYYISDPIIDGTIYTIVIKTNVDWGGAKFIIDDTKLDCKGGSQVYVTHIFEVKPDYAPTTITDKDVLNKLVAAGLGPDTKKIDLGLGYAAMIFPTDNSKTIYRRKGYGGFRGYDMKEAVVIDKDGNVDKETPLVFNYTNLSSIYVIRADETPITVENGIFTTKNSRFDTHYIDAVTGQHGAHDTNYFNRGMSVTRSNTTVKNVEHYIEGEFTIDEQLQGKIGVVYYGFFQAKDTNRVTFESCVATARRCFWRGVAWSGGSGTQGTYDIMVYTSNKTVFKNCTQSNFWVNDNAQAVPRGTSGAKLSISTSTLFAGYSANVKMYWGIGGSNDSKNMEYIGCTLSRFDAHRGLFNGKIIDTAITEVSLVGGGDFVMENVEWFSSGNGKNENGLITLRDDYGCLWDGTITIKNVKAYPDPGRQTNNPDLYWSFWICSHIYTNWDFGYQCVFPSISVENLSVYDRTTITKTNLTGEKIPVGKIAISITTGAYSFASIPDVHTDTISSQEQKHRPWYMNIDRDGDGFVDNTGKDKFGVDIKIPYVNKEIREGVQADPEEYTDNKNLNPIKPPEYLKFKNLDGHSIDFYYNDGVVPDFLKNTYIEFEGTVINNPTNN